MKNNDVHIYTDEEAEMIKAENIQLKIDIKNAKRKIAEFESKIAWAIIDLNKRKPFLN